MSEHQRTLKKKKVVVEKALACFRHEEELVPLVSEMKAYIHFKKQQLERLHVEISAINQPLVVESNNYTTDETLTPVSMGEFIPRKFLFCVGVIITIEIIESKCMERR